MIIFQLNKGRTKIIWADLAKDKKPLTEIIDSNKIYSDIRVNETDKVMLHRMDLKPKPIIRVEKPQPKHNL